MILHLIKPQPQMKKNLLQNLQPWTLLNTVITNIDIALPNMDIALPNIDKALPNMDIALPYMDIALPYMENTYLIIIVISIILVMDNWLGH